MDASRIGSTWRADAPAKLNLFLEVIGKRDDGYHEIETLMVGASLFDTLYFTRTLDETVELTAHWATGTQAAGRYRNVHQGFDETGSLDQVPAGRQNTAWRAVDLLRRTAGVTAGARIQLVKRIPSGAGLGGASTDAAAALIAANRAWQVGWDRPRLAELGPSIGSDVPFFLGESKIAGICRGRGERTCNAPCAGQLHFVVVHPPVVLSTARVYAHCRPAAQRMSVEGLADSLRSGRLAEVGRLLFNRLESAAADLSPWIARLRSHFQRLDFLGFGMSGSGSSFFGVCRHWRHARRAAMLLQLAGLGHAFAASSVSPHCRLAAISI